MFNQISLVQLQYTLALAEHKHFKKAAEACHVTQPTLSMQLQKLEDQLGLVLFDRKAVPISPTPAGKIVVQQAEKILGEVNKLRQVVESQKDEISGDFQIGLLPTIAPYLLPRIVPPITERLPLLQINAFDKTTAQIINELKNGTLHLAFMVAPYEDEEIVLHPIFKEEFVVYISHRHKLFQQEEVAYEELNPDDIWVLEEGHCFSDQVLNICGRKNSQAGKFSYKSGSLEALKRLVDKYGGMTLLPELAVEDFDSSSMRHVRRIKKPRPVREVSLAVHKNFPKMGMISKLIEIVRESLPYDMQEKLDTTTIKY